MTPEAKARSRIDARLALAGWTAQGMKQLDLGAAQGVAVREYPTDSGPADYVLFVDRQPVSVIEAKRDEAGEHLTTVESQTARYAVANLKWRTSGSPLPFLFEATGERIRFADSVLLERIRSGRQAATRPARTPGSRSMPGRTAPC